MYENKLKKELILYATLSLAGLCIIVISIFQNIELLDIYIKAKNAGYYNTIHIIEPIIPVRILSFFGYVLVFLCPLIKLIFTFKSFKNTNQVKKRRLV